MEVLAISNNPVLVRGSKHAQPLSFGSDNVEEEIRQLATIRTMEQSRTRQKQVKRLFYSIPLLAGLSAAVLTKGKSKVLDKEISGLAGKLTEGIKAGGSWAYLLGLAGAISLGEAVIAKKSEKFKDFRTNHPFLSFVGDVGLFLAASVAIPTAALKLGSKIDAKHFKKLSNGIVNVAGHVNNIKTPKFIKSIGTKLSDLVPNAIKKVKIPDFVKKTVDFAKGIGKTILAWAPHIALIAGICESVSAPVRDTNNYVRNYAEIKKAYEEEML